MFSRSFLRILIVICTLLCVTLLASPSASKAEDAPAYVWLESYSVEKGADAILHYDLPDDSFIRGITWDGDEDALGDGYEVYDIESVTGSGIISLSANKPGEYTITVVISGEFSGENDYHLPALTIYEPAPVNPEYTEPSITLSQSGTAYVGRSVNLNIDFGDDPDIEYAQIEVCDSEGLPADQCFTFESDIGTIPFDDAGSSISLTPLSAKAEPYSLSVHFCDQDGIALYTKNASISITDTAPSISAVGGEPVGSVLPLTEGDHTQIYVDFGTNTAYGIVSVNASVAEGGGECLLISIGDTTDTGATVNVQALQSISETGLILEFVNAQSDVIEALTITLPVTVAARAPEDTPVIPPSVSPVTDPQTPAELEYDEEFTITLDFGNDAEIADAIIITDDKALYEDGVIVNLDGGVQTADLTAQRNSGSGMITILFRDAGGDTLYMRIIHINVKKGSWSEPYIITGNTSFTLKVGESARFTVSAGSDRRVKGVKIAAKVLDGGVFTESYRIIAPEGDQYFDFGSQREKEFSIAGVGEGEAVLIISFYGNNGQQDIIAEYEIEMVFTVSASATAMNNDNTNSTIKGDTAATGLFGGMSAPAPQSAAPSSASTPQVPRTASAPATMDLSLDAARKAGEDAAKSAKSAPIARLRNISLASAEALAAIADAAGKNATIYADTMHGGSVDVRISFKAYESSLESVNLSASTNSAAARRVMEMFAKAFTNQLWVISCGQESSFGMAVEIMFKPAQEDNQAKIDITKLCVYTYDSRTNSYKRISVSDMKIDSNGYVRFKTNCAGTLLITQGALTKMAYAK